MWRIGQRGGEDVREPDAASSLMGEGSLQISSDGVVWTVPPLPKRVEQAKQNSSESVVRLWPRVHLPWPCYCMLCEDFREASYRAEEAKRKAFLDAQPLDALDQLAAKALERWPCCEGMPVRYLATLVRVDAGLTLRQLGYLMNVGQERVRQIYSKAGRMLRKRQATAWSRVDWRPLPLPPRAPEHSDFGVQTWTPEGQYAETLALSNGELGYLT